MSRRIRRVSAREILAGTGRPTVEVALETDEGTVFVASVPSGSSTGKYEAYELHDGDERYAGRGVRRAVAHVNETIGPFLVGMPVTDYRAIDRCMIDLDGTPNKSRLGGNAILAVSMAAARAGAACAEQPLYTHLCGPHAVTLPVPVATVLAGGRHSPSSLEFEDYLLLPSGFDTLSESVEALAATRSALQRLLEQRFGPMAESGTAFAPPLPGTEAAFDVMLEAASRAGYTGRMRLGIDVVGSDLLAEGGLYRVAGGPMSGEELAEYFVNLTRRYPLDIIEDPFDQDDLANTARLTTSLPAIQIVGDDLFATNVGRLKLGIAAGAANALLVKINQAGTVSEAVDAAQLAVGHGYKNVVSARSNETNDPFIADLAVAIGAGHIKLGAPVRGERIAKYNRLLEIEAELGALARYAGHAPSGVAQ